MLLHSRTAGLAAPLDSVFPAIEDRDGLARTTRDARDMGFDAMMATELEFYLFDNSYESLRGGIAGLMEAQRAALAETRK